MLTIINSITLKTTLAILNLICAYMIVAPNRNYRTMVIWGLCWVAVLDLMWLTRNIDIW